MRTGRWLTTAVWLTIAVLSTSARATASSEKASTAPTGGIFLLVHSTSDKVTIQRVTAAQTPTTPAKPSVPVAGWERNPPGTEELIVTFHDKKGKLLGEYGFPTRRLAFSDTLEAGGTTLTGGPRGLAYVDLPLHVPAPINATFLYLWRVMIRPRDPAGPVMHASLSWKVPGSGPYGPVALTLDPLGGYPLKGPIPELRKFELPRFPPPRTLKESIARVFVVKEDLLTLLKDHPIGPVGPSGQPPPPPTPACPSNAFTSQNIGSGTPPATSFNIVILGDGYRAAQMDFFHQDALNTLHALLRVSPFLDFASGINAFRVDTPSTDSGVDYCPKECRKQVCYRGSNDGGHCSTDTACPGGSCDRTKTCLLGPNDLSPCSWDVDCPGGGMCDPSGFCDSGPKGGFPCRSGADCAGKNCIRIEKVCHLGTKAGVVCTTNADCPSGTCQPASGCPVTDPDSKATALDVSGDASKLGVCTEFKADDPTKLSDAACSVLDPADVDLTIVLVNSDAYGGMTYPSSKTIFVSARHAPEIIAHEAAHAVANIGEEYIAGIVPCPTTACGVVCGWPIKFANVALPAEVASNTVSWYSLTTAAERASGTFATIENSGSGVCYPTIESHRPWLPGTTQALGLYWGAQYVADAPDPVSAASPCLPCRVPVNGQCMTLCLSSCDQRGDAYYRPMPRCMMRAVNEPFCRVCYCELRAVLTAQTGLAVSAPQCQTALPLIPLFNRNDDQRTGWPPVP